jgi:PAT family beta-lactamase induction signal transducer AmpG
MPFRLTLDTRARRLLAFSLFYLSEGLPFGFSTVALAAYLRQQGVPMATVGAVVAASYAPWAFKWAVAPLVDLIRIQRFGASRTWILFCHSGMILTLAMILAFDVVSNPNLLIGMILIHNILAATSDVAIDAMAVRVLPPLEMGTANGCMFGAQFAGIALGGSGALYVAGAWGFRAGLLFLLLSLLAILLGVTLPLLEPADTDIITRRSGISLPAAILERLKIFLKLLHQSFFRSGATILVAALFAVFPHGAMGLALALSAGLQVDMKMSEQLIGNINLVSNGMAALGAFLGGWLSDRTRSPRLWIMVSYLTSTSITFALSLQFTGAGTIGVTVLGFFLASTVYNFAFGIQSGAANGMFMLLSSKAVAATQFTTFMALSNFAYTYSSYWQGRAIDLYGYPATLKLDACLGLTGLLVLYWVRPQNKTYNS